LGAEEGVDVLVLMDCAAAGDKDEEVVGGMVPLPMNRAVKVAVQVLARGEEGVAVGEGGGWAEFVPGLEVCRTEVESGMFLDFSMVSFPLFRSVLSLLLLVCLAHANLL
jgi:hypothetical protein